MERITIEVKPEDIRRVAMELHKKIMQLGSKWVSVEVSIAVNPPVKISCHGSYKDGFQGAIKVKLGDKTVTADLKRGRAVFYLGDVLQENDIPTFIELVNTIVGLWQWYIKPLLNAIPPEYHIARSWGLEVTLADYQCRLPPCFNKSATLVLQDPYL